LSGHRDISAKSWKYIQHFSRIYAIDRIINTQDTFLIDICLDIFLNICQFYVPILTIAHVPNLTQNVPNLTGNPNVPKIEQSPKTPNVNR
jgi:hypothetical protein